MNRRAGLIIGGLVVLVVLAALFVFMLGGGDRESELARSAVEADAGTEETAESGTAPSAKKSTATRIALPDAGAQKEANVFVQAPWGSSQGQLGRERRPEGNAEGPMSLSVGRNGEVVVLDQSNGRLARFDGDGKFKDTVPVPVQSAQELVQGADGKTYVMDRLADGVVAILDKDGKPMGELPLVGASVKEGGAITGLFVDGTDVYVEQEHGVLNRIGDTSGKRDETQPEIPGRPTRDGRSYISAGIVDPAAGRVYVTAIDRQALAQRFTREFRLTPATAAILLLDTDASGIIYFAVMLSPPDGKETVQLLCLDPLDGRALGTTVIPPNTLPEETFRDFAVLDSGGVLYSYRTEQGVELRRYDCR